MNTTVRLKASEITKDWHVIDAAGRPLGRIATEAAILLRGKHKPTFEPHLDGGDFVIVINASQVRVTGKKAEQNNYYTHSGYPGGLKTRSFAVQLARHPERVIEQAVWGMLPKGPLGKHMSKHLKVYPNANHPHASQITGSERAVAARKAAAAEAVVAPLKTPRLRPLGGLGTPDLVEETPVIIAEVAPPPAKAPRPPRATTPEAAAPEASVPEVATPEAAAPEASVPEVEAPAAVEVESAGAEPTVAEEPKKRTRKKAAEATTETAPEAAEAAATEE